MNLAVLIPDRNDRPEFLKNCFRMMEAQTLKPNHIELVNDPPRNHHKDISWRYRTGYDRLRGKGFDLIAFIENDDWYSPEYFEMIIGYWKAAGRPDMFGTNYTYYYNLRLRKYFKFEHNDRASAMNTFIKPDLTFPWSRDEDPYTDIWLWHRSGLNGKLCFPKKIISVGIKHGVGLCGGFSHVDRLKNYKTEDGGFLKETLDEESFNFYDRLTFE